MPPPRAQPPAPAGRIGVRAPYLLGRRQFAQHRIQVAGPHKYPEPGTPHCGEVVVPAPVRLCCDADPVAFVLQEPADQGGGEGGVVDVGVPADEEEIQFLPTPGLHIPTGDGQKGGMAPTGPGGALLQPPVSRRGLFPRHDPPSPLSAENAALRKEARGTSPEPPFSLDGRGERI